MVRSSIFVLFIALAVPAMAQTPANQSSFHRWIAEGEREQIPWKVEVDEVELRLDQRLSARIAVILDESRLNKHGEQHDLILLARIGQEANDWLPSTSWLGKRLEGPLGPRTQLVFTMEVLVLPGRYRLGLVLLDQISGDRSVTVRQLRVNPIHNDPLPQSFPDFPPAEFVHTADGVMEPSHLGLTRSKWLPVQTRRPVQVELLVNFGHSEEFALPRVEFVNPRGSRWGSTPRRTKRSPQVEKNLDVILEALKPLTALSVANGSLRFTGLDLVGRRVLWEQDLADGMDWPRLHEALSKFNSSMVSVQTLAGQKESPAFFREIIEQRLAATDFAGSSITQIGGSDSPSKDRPAGESPLRILIVLSSTTLFSRGAEVTPVRLPEGCDCRVYFLRLNLLGNLWDQLHEILEPLKPRRFDIENPKDYRRALGVILQELRQL